MKNHPAFYVATPVTLVRPYASIKNCSVILFIACPGPVSTVVYLFLILKYGSYPSYKVIYCHKKDSKKLNL